MHPNMQNPIAPMRTHSELIHTGQTSTSHLMLGGKESISVEMLAMTQQLQLPTFDAMMLPTLRALQQLGGSGTNAEIYNTVIKLLSLPDVIVELPHRDTSTSEVEYRLAWSRTYLKKAGYVENSARSVWSLCSAIGDIDDLDPRQIVRSVQDRAKSSEKIPSSKTPSLPVDSTEVAEEISLWHEQLHKLLLSLTSDAFERLAQRLLRESGIIQVEVTGRSGDGGIDGVGIARVAGFLSFRVLFQCKRYQGSINPSQIRDFRGAMQGRTDKGLFITTGTFSRDAIRKANRDGAPAIDLIDGEQLVQRLKELELGVKVRMVEAIEIDTDWFRHL